MKASLPGSEPQNFKLHPNPNLPQNFKAPPRPPEDPTTPFSTPSPTSFQKQDALLSFWNNSPWTPFMKDSFLTLTPFPKFFRFVRWHELTRAGPVIGSQRSSAMLQE